MADSEALVEAHNKDELLALADEAGAEVAKSWTKEQIADAIVHTEGGDISPDSVVVDQSSQEVVVDRDRADDPSVMTEEVVNEKTNAEPDFADPPRDEGPQQVKSVERIAREMINGEWGDGEERQVRLERLGYDFDEVKAEAVRQLGLD